MKIVTNVIPYPLLYPITKSYVKEEIAFFDIETTGFSPDMSYVYLISCGYYKEDRWNLIQWFSEGIEEEKQLLCLFFDFLVPYRLLIHYNGTTFDIPYLLSKCAQHDLSYNFKHITSFDIYKKIIPYKNKLPIENLKLKTVERFLGLHRKDQFHGGELIHVYAEYVGRNAYEKFHNTADMDYPVTKASGLPTVCKTKASHLLEALLLHNAEDVMGLLKVMDILSYVDFFQGDFIHCQATVNETKVSFTLTLMNELPLPLSFEQSIGDVSYTVTAQKRTAQVIVPLTYGTKKFFLEDYKDYYYLPVEDTAVHKSVGEYVDKEFRQNAKPSTCYIKKEGHFLPQPIKLITPAFKDDYKSKLFWFEATQDILKEECKQMEYVAALLK